MNIGALNNGISGIQVSLTRMARSGHDVANVNTPAFEEGQVQQSSRKEGGADITGIKLHKNSDPTRSNTDIAEETSQQIQSEKGLKANVNVLRTQDQMLGDLLDIMA